MRFIADILYTFAGVLYLPVLAYQAFFRNKNRTGWSERFGGIILPAKSGTRVWVHAVSLGEVNATRSVIAYMKAHHPELEIVVSTTTDTGYSQAVSLYGQGCVFRFPLDFSPVVHKAFQRIQPDVIVLVELEIWYNLTRLADKQNIPVVIMNGRLSKKSHARFTQFSFFVTPMFRRLSHVVAQDEETADRFVSLGVARDCVMVVPSLKWDTAEVTDAVTGTRELRQAMGICDDKPVLVCGSTGYDEEQILVDVYSKLVASHESLRDLQLVVVPRKPETFDEVASYFERNDIRCIRRSGFPDGAPPPESHPDNMLCVYLGDTMGELRKFYSLADLVFVGRSMVPMGGSDPIEVAGLSKPMIMGPYHDNFKLPVSKLSDAGALVVVDDRESFIGTSVRLLSDGAVRHEMGIKARDVVLSHQGGTQKTVTCILSHLD